tara:strand:+ start:649 stop:1410 length:762 start_codon:yes stop_codon:yes gene_type:complete
MFSNQNHSIERRREIVFLVLSGIFLGTLAMLNVLGISRFIDLSFTIGSLEIPFIVAVGVLPYPITFLCTDLISELYGKRRASQVVWVGLLLNVWVLFILWMGGVLDQPEQLTDGKLPLQMEDGQPVAPHGYSFYDIRYMAFGATMASMIAYLTAQFVDVQVFHFVKAKTKGKKLWLRNNVSTLTSQLVDSIAVVLITYYYAKNLPVDEAEPVYEQLVIFILSAYLFKVIAALLDTIPFYLLTNSLKRYLKLME